MHAMKINFKISDFLSYFLSKNILENEMQASEIFFSKFTLNF
jgi:hypothetical protein